MKFAKFEGFQVRITYHNDVPYMVAKDVCEALYITNTSQALADLDNDEKIKITTICLNDSSKAKQKTQKLLHVSESGVYSLLFRSRKKEAKRFRKWVTKDVLPTIRATGSYSLQKRNTQWLQKRQEGIGIRKTEVEIIQQFVDYATLQGANEKGVRRYYSTFTNEVYKALSVEKGQRNNVSGLKLYQISLLEMTIANSLQKAMDNKMHYKDAYQQAKADFLQVAELAGFKADKKALNK